MKALGIPEAISSLPEVAHLVLELIAPPKEGQLSEAELDERAEEIKARQDAEEGWYAALHGAYKGPRGQHEPELPELPPVPELPMTPIHTHSLLNMTA